MNERSIAHKFATYLEDEFQGWDVDCEYNRNLEKQKRLKLPEESSLDVQPVNIRATVYMQNLMFGMMHHTKISLELCIIAQTLNLTDNLTFVKMTPII